MVPTEKLALTYPKLVVITLVSYSFNSSFLSITSFLCSPFYTSIAVFPYGLAKCSCLILSAGVLLDQI